MRLAGGGGWVGLVGDVGGGDGKRKGLREVEDELKKEMMQEAVVGRGGD